MNTPAEAAALAVQDYKPSAAKRGRNPKWPHVPVLIVGGGTSKPGGYTQQIKGKAFATHEEAVAYAQLHIDNLRTSLEARLAMPNHRALRAQYDVA